MDKIQRATEIHRGMTPHQMALRIVELQDALELAEEAVRANHPEIPDGWKLVPMEPTFDMKKSALSFPLFDDDLNPTDLTFEEIRGIYRAMLAAAPKLGGE